VNYLSCVSSIFDQEFYNNYYGCQSTVDNFIKDYIDQGRYIHRCILDDQFNYALFASKLNWYNNHVSNSCDALMYYLIDKPRYSSWFGLKHPQKTHSSHSTTAIYYAHINSELTLDVAQKSIQNILPCVQEPKIIVSGKPRYITYIKSLFGSNTVIELSQLSDWSIIKDHIKNFSKCLYTNNKLYLYKNIDYLINNYTNNSIISLIDKYNTIYYSTDLSRHSVIPKPFYTLNSNFFVFDQTIYSGIVDILQNLTESLTNDFKLNYHLTEYCLKKKLPIEFFYQQELEKEAFWHNLLGLDLLNHQALITKHNIPAINIQVINNYCKLYNKNKILDNIDQLLSKNNIPDLKHLRVACHIHIGKSAQAYISDVKTTIDRLKKNNFDIDFYLTSNEIIPDINTIIVPNKGADVGPFLYILNAYILNNKYKYDYILKLHTKTHHGFRKLVYDTLVANLSQNLDILENHQESCIIGVGSHEMNIEKNDININLINQFCSKYKINTNNNSFYTGTMFIAKTSMFKEFSVKYKIDYMSEYYGLEDGYEQNHSATQTHTWERILSGIIPSSIGKTKLSL